MNSIRLGFNNTIPAPKDRVILTPEGFAKYVPAKEGWNLDGFFLCDMQGNLVVWFNRDSEERLSPLWKVNEWVDFF